MINIGSSGRKAGSEISVNGNARAPIMEPSETYLEIIKTARTEVDHSISLHDFTRKVNEVLDAGEKAALIELLWEVAVADNVIDKYEEYFIRKIADLLYVPHKDYIKAKHRASA